MDPSHIWGKTEALDYLKSGRDHATNEPGSGYGYSNSNYTLLGLIIEKVTGHEAVREIHERLLAPRGLMDVRFEGFEPVDAARVPSRYHFGTAAFVRDAGLHPSFRRVRGPIIDVSRSNLSTEWTAGAVLATAHDLALFVRDLRDGHVVSAAALRRMSTFGAAVGWVPGEDVVIALLTNVGAMHAGDTAYYPEKLLKDSRLIAAARAVARERWRVLPAPRKTGAGKA